MAVDPDLCNIGFQLLMYFDQLNLVIKLLQQFIYAIHASGSTTGQNHQISAGIS